MFSVKVSSTSAVDEVDIRDGDDAAADAVGDALGVVKDTCSFRSDDDN